MRVPLPRSENNVQTITCDRRERGSKNPLYLAVLKIVLLSPCSTLLSTQNRTNNTTRTSRTKLAAELQRGRTASAERMPCRPQWTALDMSPDNILAVEIRRVKIGSTDERMGFQERR